MNLEKIFESVLREGENFPYFDEYDINDPRYDNSGKEYWRYGSKTAYRGKALLSKKEADEFDSIPKKDKIKRSEFWDKIEARRKKALEEYYGENYT